MSDVAMKAISGNAVKNGGITFKTTQTATQTKNTSLGSTPDITELQAKLTTRFDDTQYYTA